MLHVDKDDLSPTAEVWAVDQGLISKLKEQYKKERKGKKGVKSKCSYNYYCFSVLRWNGRASYAIDFLCYKGSN